ncbi:hypothetical protein GCM10023231_26020 [Olivibacter ginsenosidimutans]|uniref:TonB-dependent receptor n=1 Tax=Olivibacter ginsenosidimutans TaxID=1176537 RepID=A0ABP9BM25_9SPHI
MSTTAIDDTLTTHLNEVTVTENRLRIPFTEQNRNIDILTKEDIKQLPAHSINELLSYIAGVDVRQRGPWGAQADISIDGGTFEQTMILVNGVKVSDPQTAHHSMNIPVPLGAIERIEVIRGPAARIYGINSLTGAINIVTRVPEKQFFDAQLNASSSFKNKEEGDGKGIYNGRGIQLGAGLTTDRSNHLIYGSYDTSNGYRYNTPFHNGKIFYQGKIRNDLQNSWNLMAGYTHNDFGANAYYAPPHDREAREIVQTALFSIDFDGHLSDRWSIKPRLSYRYNHDDYRYDQHNLDLYRNLHHTHVATAEINTTYRTDVGTIGFGLEARNEFMISSNMGNRKRGNYGVYAEYKTAIINRLAANIGAYLNYNSKFGWQIYPGLDLGYTLTNHWRLYVNTGSGERVPSFTDLYTTGGGNIGNPELTPEKAWYAESGIKFNDQRWFLNASYFYRKITDFIDWTRPSAEENWEPSNFLQNQVQGINIASKLKIASEEENKWYIGLSYNFLKPKIINANSNNLLSKYAIESLKHQLVASASWHTTHLSMSVAQRFVERISYKNYFITDFKAHYRWEKYVIKLEANNLFDITYIETSTIPLPGRWFSLGLNYAL